MSKCSSRNLAPAQGQLAEMVELHAKAEETVDALSEAEVYCCLGAFGNWHQWIVV